MSISSLANAAAARRPDFSPAQTVPSGYGQIAHAADAPPVPAPAGAAQEQAKSASDVDTALNLLIGHIPTEILTLYVAILAALQHQAAAPHRPQWITFLCFLVATPIVVWLVFGAKLKAAQKPLPLAFRTWPVWEMFAATVAYLVWAFGLPETPFAEFSWYSSALAGIAVLLASIVLGLLAPFFQRELGT
jgi:hypothetical protein